MKRHLDTCCGKRHYRRCHVKGEGLSARKRQQETSGDVHGVRSQISYRQGDISSNKHLRPTQAELFLKMMFRLYFLNTSKRKFVECRAALGCSATSSYVGSPKQILQRTLVVSNNLFPSELFISRYSLLNVLYHSLITKPRMVFLA